MNINKRTLGKLVVIWKTQIKHGIVYLKYLINFSSWHSLEGLNDYMSTLFQVMAWRFKCSQMTLHVTTFQTKRHYSNILFNFDSIKNWIILLTLKYKHTRVNVVIFCKLNQIWPTNCIILCTLKYYRDKHTRVNMVILCKLNQIWPKHWQR